mmetsp:Transcript_62409/g.56272  ORF Transcript_62409/g.56272 Transcript_62409/m.56272 type:complete len:398 (-) Transcript_62409:55-1248(-)
MLSDFATGTILAFCCSICFGTQTSFAKIPSVVSSKVRMEIFNIYFMIGVAIVCLIGHLVLSMLLGEFIEFSYMGVISALLLYFGELFMLLTVQQIGVAYGMALSILSSAVASIIAQYFLGQTIDSYLITIAGFGVVTLSVMGCVFLKQILSYINLLDYSDTEKSIILMPKQDSVVNILSETAPLVNLNQLGNSSVSTSADETISYISNDDAHIVKYSKQMVLGFIFSSLGGICYCLVPLPSLYVTEYSAGIKFSLSFGIGCLIVLPLSILNILIINPFHKKEDVDGNDEMSISTKDLIWKLISFNEELYHFKSACLAGIGGGFVWGIGNLMGICTFLYLDYVIVMVYVQFHIVVSLLYGICIWKEITQTIEMISLSFLTLTLIGGCIIVTYGVYGSL